jgi:hypothetical protein
METISDSDINNLISQIRYLLDEFEKIGGVNENSGK